MPRNIDLEDARRICHSCARSSRLFFLRFPSPSLPPTFRNIVHILFVFTKKTQLVTPNTNVLSVFILYWFHNILTVLSLRVQETKQVSTSKKKKKTALVGFSTRKVLLVARGAPRLPRCETPPAFYYGNFQSVKCCQTTYQATVFQNSPKQVSILTVYRSIAEIRAHIRERFVALWARRKSQDFCISAAAQNRFSPASKPNRTNPGEI